MRGKSLENRWGTQPQRLLRRLIRQSRAGYLAVLLANKIPSLRSAFMRQCVAQRYNSVFRRIPVATTGELYTSAAPKSRYDPHGRLLKVYSSCGIEHVFSLMTGTEMEVHKIPNLSGTYRSAGLAYTRFPIDGHPVRTIDSLSLDSVSSIVETITGQLRRNVNCVIHCKAGINRSPLIAAFVISAIEGISPQDSIQRIMTQQQIRVPGISE